MLDPGGTHMRVRSWRTAAAGAVAVGTLIALSGVGAAAPGGLRGAAVQIQSFKSHSQANGSGLRGGDDASLADQQAAYDNERVAPGSSLSGGALVSAVQAKDALPTVGGAWQEMTTEAYNGQPPNYTDPFWGNEGAGFSIVGGRTTALAQTPDGDWFAGTADGGVWRSSDQGQHWTPTFDNMPSLSIGALAVDPTDGSLWVGTGEANTSQDSYAGAGVYRSANDGTTYQRIGDDISGNNPLESHTVFQLTFDPNGNLYAGTNDGLWRKAAGSSTWDEVLAPAGEPQFPPYANQATSVVIVPGSGGMDVVAAVAWRSADFPTNGFYESTDGGLTFSAVTVSGDIDASDIGRTTFAYSADGTKLYAIVESPNMLNAGAASVLQGIFVSTGAPASVAGPWTKIADATKLTDSGSAAPTFGSPGVQAWYNQDLAVDPADPNHVYAGLEEVYQSNDGGNTWVTASPYWNYNFPCDSTNTCPNVTHPDQHAMMIAGDQIVIGNDGGVYSRPLADANENDGTWSDLNATLRDLQYYDARAGSLPGGGLGVWGGLQDNGSSILLSGSNQMSEAAGGDGFDVIVDPNNANNLAGEYVDGTMYTTRDGGHSFADFISPTCEAQIITGLPGGPRRNCDPAARFVTPVVQDQQVATTWLLGGEDVWVSHAGWNTKCQTHGCNWHNVFDTGAGNAVTALSSVNDGNTIYAAWVAGGGNPGPAFGSGIATNFGGKWHQVSVAGLPDRYIAGVTADPSNPAHAYAVFNGYSRRWIPGGGVGHVFETWNGGASWTDISGDLPDIASDALVLEHGSLALATDAGVFTATEGQGASTVWSVLGSGLPNTSVNDLTVGPGGFIYASTHGRGIWRIAF
jgi:sugar lactone lactonase YvrE